MTTKNLEKLAEIREKKLRNNLVENLFEIKRSLTDIQINVISKNNLE